ncbi:MAG: hypothetical protein IT245_06635, partial [Bacteroidia bacterium]|nr:hypothetical protein [Bacteroidia bacterium]
MEFRISSINDYNEACKLATEQPESFWDSIAENYTWRKKWDKTLEWNFDEPSVKWFINGQLN